MGADEETIPLQSSPPEIEFVGIADAHSSSARLPSCSIGGWLADSRLASAPGPAALRMRLTQEGKFAF